MADFSAWIEKNKALWTRVYDEVIAPDFEAEWKKRDDAHKQQLKQKEEKEQILFNHVSDEVVKKAHLVEENADLKRQLQQMLGEAPSAPGESTVSAEEYRHLTEKYNDLSKKYQDLSQQMKYLERKNNAIMQKNKAMKESVRAWQEYADRQSGKQKPKNKTKAEEGRPRLSTLLHFEDIRPHMPSSPGSIAAVRTPLSLAELGHSSPAQIAPLVTPGSELRNAPRSPRLHNNDEPGEARSRSGSVTPKPTDLSQTAQQQTGFEGLTHIDRPQTTATTMNAGGHVQSYLQAANPSSSQTTVDESADPVTRQMQLALTMDDDDVPQFVSARSLKRKRGQPSKIDIYADRSSDGTPVKPFRVKEEQDSSPPNAIHSLVRKDTIDLDDLASNVLQTPWHHMRKSTIHPNIPASLRHQRSNSAPLSQGIKRESTRVDPLAGIPSVRVETTEPQIANADPRALSDPIDSVTDVLRPIDPNIVAPAQEEPLNKRMRAEARKSTIVGILTESGEESPPVGENELRLPPSVARAKLNRRLHPLKDPESPESSADYPETPATAKVKLEQNPTPPASSSRMTQTPLARPITRKPGFQAQIAERDSPATTERSTWKMKAPEARPSARKCLVADSKKQSRLRSKPVTELKVHDFKPNPVYNQGYSYAFSETVRKRDERMCLPGCTNPQCCGSTFRTLAEAQAPLPSSQEEAMLEDYLGDAYDHMNLTQMSSEERQELILQARTKKIAKEAGKHREAYERRRTPPGFWRVDFPTTQEQQEDRERAKEQEKKVVQERWLEAQRRGGKWIFRDE